MRARGTSLWVLLTAWTALVVVPAAKAQVFAAGAYASVGPGALNGVGGYAGAYYRYSGLQLGLGAERPPAGGVAQFLFSADDVLVVPTGLRRLENGCSLAVVGDLGYSVLAGAGSGLTYGGGFLLPYRSLDGGYRGVRFEYRDESVGGVDHVRTFRIAHEWGVAP